MRKGDRGKHQRRRRGAPPNHPTDRQWLKVTTKWHVRGFHPTGEGEWGEIELSVPLDRTDAGGEPFESINQGETEAHRFHRELGNALVRAAGVNFAPGSVRPAETHVDGNLSAPPGREAVTVVVETMMARLREAIRAETRRRNGA